MHAFFGTYHLAGVALAIGLCSKIDSHSLPPNNLTALKAMGTTNSQLYHPPCFFHDSQLNPWKRT
jgi:hypothetical protein